MTRKILGIFVTIQAASAAILVVGFGSLFFFFEKSPFWQFIPATFLGLLSVAVVCQFCIGMLIYRDVRKRHWNSEIKRDLWVCIGRSEYYNFNFSLFLIPFLSIAYYLIMIKNGGEKEWWARQREKSFLFRILTEEGMLGTLHNIREAWPYAALAGVLLFALSGALYSGRLSVLSFKVLGLVIALVTPLALIFYFLVLLHILSKEWSDYSFEVYLKDTPYIIWSNPERLDIRRYYRTVMRTKTETGS